MGSGRWAKAALHQKDRRVEETEFAEKKKYEQHQQVSLTYFNVFKIR